MRITEITSRHRNDFWADLACEHCDHTETDWGGYEDRNYHENVMPRFHCKACGKNRAGELKRGVS